MVVEMDKRTVNIIKKVEKYIGIQFSESDKVNLYYLLTEKDNATSECGYCGAPVGYNEVGLLCEDCRETFGHSTIDEL